MPTSIATARASSSGPRRSPTIPRSSAASRPAPAPPSKRFRVQAGKQVAAFTALLAPNVSHKGMADLKLIAPKAPRGVTALLTQGYLAAASFSDRAKTVALAVQRKELDDIHVL